LLKNGKRTFLLAFTSVVGPIVSAIWEYGCRKTLIDWWKKKKLVENKIVDVKDGKLQGRKLTRKRRKLLLVREEEVLRVREEL
jgi:hypothetical protein